MWEEESSLVLISVTSQRGGVLMVVDWRVGLRDAPLLLQNVNFPVHALVHVNVTAFVCKMIE